MKKIITIVVLALGVSVYAQEAGAKGELLRNEASNSEMQKQADMGIVSANVQRSNNNSFNNNGRNNNQSNVRNDSYRWNQNYGYSEVFLRIPENGYFTVKVGDQVMSNGAGKYRFFDLGAGRIPLSIYANGYLVYKTQLNVPNNSRMVLDFFTRQGLYLLDTYPVKGQMYGFNQWDDVWNNPYNNGGYNNQPSNPNAYGNVMDNASFSQFLNAYRKNANFDKDRREFILAQVRNTRFTTEQIMALLKPFSFDDVRLEMAKTLYRSCVDQPNYYRVADVFSFESGKRDLRAFLANPR